LAYFEPREIFWFQILVSVNQVKSINRILFAQDLDYTHTQHLLLKDHRQQLLSRLQLSTIKALTFLIQIVHLVPFQALLKFFYQFLTQIAFLPYPTLLPYP